MSMASPCMIADGNPVSGDVTDQVDLWDAGTEVNQPIGEGDQQAPRQAAPNTGDVEMGAVQLVSDLDDGLAYPAADDIISVTLTPGDTGEFSVRIDNVSGDSDFPTPITPIFWVVEARDAGTMNDMEMKYGALFTSGYQIYGNGLEHLAEDGDTSALVSFYGINGFATPLAPVVWAVHDDTMGVGIFFTSGEADRGDGLEALAEDGIPSVLLASLGDGNHGAQAVPDGADGPGPAFPGDSYSFSFTASPGQYLSFATMFVQSNDLFFGPDEAGIPLFDGMGYPIEGDVTGRVDLWDAGTEVNQEPGIGADQAPRQAGPNTGADEMGVVRLVADSGKNGGHLPRSSYYHRRAKPRDQQRLREAIADLVGRYPTYGSRRVRRISGCWWVAIWRGFTYPRTDSGITGAHPRHRITPTSAIFACARNSSISPSSWMSSRGWYGAGI